MSILTDVKRPILYENQKLRVTRLLLGSVCVGVERGLQRRNDARRRTLCGDAWGALRVGTTKNEPCAYKLAVLSQKLLYSHRIVDTQTMLPVYAYFAAKSCCYDSDGSHEGSEGQCGGDDQPGRTCLWGRRHYDKCRGHVTVIFSAHDTWLPCAQTRTALPA